MEFNLRLAPEMLKAAGALRQRQGGHCARNKSIAERVWWENSGGNSGVSDA
jgi:hypothetical protein